MLGRGDSLYIDHIVLSQWSAGMVRPGSFEQVVYDDPESLKEKLSDHCRIAIENSYHKGANQGPWYYKHPTNRPGDPHRLDGNGDGEACEGLR